MPVPVEKTNMDAAESVANGFCRTWKRHIEQRSNSDHVYGLRNELDGTMTVFCRDCGKPLSQSAPFGSSDQGRIQDLFEKCVATR